MIRPEIADDPDFIRRFDTETQLAKAIDHPRIVGTIDRWRQPGAAYVTMPLFDRGSLQAALDRDELTLDDALQVFDHVAEALGAAHRLGVVHGNLKPTNILLDTDGNASVADFAMDASMSSTPFTAPEQQTGSEATKRADGYTLAMIAQHVMRSIDRDLSEFGAGRCRARSRHPCRSIVATRWTRAVRSRSPRGTRPRIPRTTRRDRREPLRRAASVPGARRRTVLRTANIWSNGSWLAWAMRACKAASSCSSGRAVPASRVSSGPGSWPPVRRGTRSVTPISGSRRR